MSTQPQPNEDMKTLDRLVGTWKMTGDLVGTLTYTWMANGFFLRQDSQIEDGEGGMVEGLEIIGHLQPMSSQQSVDIKSRLYDSAGSTFDYTYEIKDDVFIIWDGDRGSSSYFKGEFSEDGNSITGQWIYPDYIMNLAMTRE